MLRIVFPRNGGRQFQRAAASAMSARAAQFVLPYQKTTLISSQQTRSFMNWTNDLSNRQRVILLKKALDASPNDTNKMLAYFKAQNEVSPQQVAAAIDNGWKAGTIPLNEAFLKEFLKASGKLNKFDSMNVSELLAKANLANSGMSNAEVASLYRTTANTGGGGGSVFSAGHSAAEPLFIQAAPKSNASQAWQALRYTIFLFMLFAAFNAFTDDKGKGTAGGGIASRLGMGSVVHIAENPDKSFDDVVGIDEAKGDLEEIVMYLKDPKKFTRLGGKLPKGVLLTGPPGTGKTLLARAIAGEAKVPFFHTSGSEFEEMFVGVGAKRVRDLFEAAKQKSPSIIFIDEIDAIGGKRELKDQAAMKMTLNQLLVEMDGFEQNTGVIVIAATNFPDSLDNALIRPGRFDKHVDVPMPDIGGRKAILELYGKKVPLDKDVDMEQLARGTPGFSGAELFNLINQAALKASIDNLNKVTMASLEYAKDKIMMGAERKSAVISPETMKLTAFHEAGHALVALRTAGANPIHKATIMPRGRALGMVMQLPDGDQTSMSRKQMLAMLDVCMGGRVAEELVFGYDNVTSGASSDIQQATRIAKAMVTQYGLSEKVGMLFIDEKAKQSGETTAHVDQEVKELLNASYARTKALLEANRRDLEIIAKGLLQYESLAGGEIVDLINGKALTSARSQKPSRATQALPAARGAAAAVATATVPTAAAVQPKPTGAAAPVPAAAKTTAGPATSAADKQDVNVKK